MHVFNKFTSINLIEASFKIVLTVTLIGSLITNDLFAGKTLFPFYIFTIGTGLLCVISGIEILWLRKSTAVLPLFQFLAINLLLIFFIVHYCYNPSPKGIFMISAPLLLLACTTFFIDLTVIKWVLNCIVLVALAECVISLLQWTGIVGSFNSLFKVTGTYLNPNVTAMFIAMAFPATVLMKNRKYAIAGSTFLIIAVLLLQCRTAVVGIAAGGIPLILGNKKIREVYKSLNLKKKTGFLILLLIVISITGLSMYYFKKESADGRVHIWKTTVNMISQKPLWGHGFGLFEKNYNLHQIHLNNKTKFSTGSSSKAQFTEMAYNDYLELVIESGIVGFFLWTILQIYLTKIALRKLLVNDSNNSTLICFSGIITFQIMMMVNFSIQAIPAFLVFLIYLSSLFAGKNQKPFKQIHIVILGILLSISGCILFINQVVKAQASYKHKTALLLANKKRFGEAILVEESVKSQLFYYESYWKGYGNILMKQEKYKEALDCFQNALKLSSNPSLMANAGSCCLKLDKPDDAISYFQIASSIEPKKISYKEGLMMSYHKSGNITQTVNTANEILNWKSEKASEYKERAKSLMNTIQQ